MPTFTITYRPETGLPTEQVQAESVTREGHHVALRTMVLVMVSDVKVVQARLWHASATTTLNTYSDLWPASEEGTRATVAAVLADRADSVRTGATADA